MMPAITRRAFGALAASLLIGSRVRAQDATPWAERFERWLDAEAERMLAAGARARQRLTTAEDVRRHADRVRREILEAMGGLPVERTPLNARVTPGFEREGYRVDDLVFESLPGFFVTGNLYVPTANGTGTTTATATATATATTHGAAGRWPAVLGTAGHSDVGKAADTYQPVWANLARRGVMVLAYDPPGQGERFEAYDASTKKALVGTGTRAHNRAGQQCLLTGATLARYFAWDGIRAVDYLLTRPDVDPARIGVAGNSGGGTQASWLAVVEPRLAAVVSSCYITSWSLLWKGPGPQDMEQILPGFLSRGLDFPDMIAAVAPKPYLVSSAIRDFFPIDGARQTVAEARRLYTTFGANAGAALGSVENDAPHGWSQPLREAAAGWFERQWFTKRDAASSDTPSDASEHAITLEPADRLRATPTGQVETSFQGTRTIFDINAESARELARTRPPVTAERLRAFLQIPAKVQALKISSREPAATIGGLRVEPLELTANDAAGGVMLPTLPALLVHPRTTSPRGSVIITGGRDGGALADDQLSADNAANSSRAKHWAERGYLTLILHVRGAGALMSKRAESGYNADYQLAARSWLLGTSLVAWQTHDLIAGLMFLERELPGSAGTECILHAEGITAPAALFASALHRPHPTAAWIENGLVSYLDLATSRDYDATARLFIPGILEVTDLPEVMKLASPAAIHLVRPRRADGRIVQSMTDLRDAAGGHALPDNVTLEATV